MGKRILGLTLFMIALSTLLGLGTWQVKRLYWKASIITALDAEYAKDPHQNRYKFSDLKDIESDAIRYGSISGILNLQKQILVGPKTVDSTIGYDALTPLKINGGGYIFVHQGFMTSEQVEQQTISNKNQVITGILRAPQANRFTPNNNAERNVWLRLHPEEMAKARNISPISSLIMYKEADKKWYPRNKHKQYAFFWFTMAVVWFGYGLVLLRRRK